MRRPATLFLIALICLIAGMEMQARSSRPAIAWRAMKSLVAGPATPGVRIPAEKPVPCPPKAITILLIGQSHGANYAGERFRTDGRTFVAVGRKCYRANDPLPGTDGDRGNLWTEVGNRLARRSGRDFVLLNASISATKIGQWAPGGNLHDHLMGAVRQRPAEVSAVAIQIGEGDYGGGTPRGDFARDLGATINAVREAGIDAPVFVARGSRFCGRMRPSQTITAAQNDVLNSARRIFAGPDLDAVAGRYDGCHFSGLAARKVASLWVDTLYAELAR